MIDLSTLYDSQRKAVDWNEGALMMLAGPGTGKTHVLTYRIARLVENSPRKYFKILGLTYTNKAAMDMRNRISTLVPHSDRRIRPITFHSFCEKILRQHASHIGLTPSLSVLSQDSERQVLLDEAIGQNKFRYSTWTATKLLPLITQLIEDNRSPNDVRSYLQRSPFRDCETLAEIYRRYRSLMIEKNSLDHVGLIAETLNLLNPPVQRQIQTVYPYICVDDFQYTNHAQYQLLRLIVNAKTKNLFVAADDEQIFHQCNGAVSNRLEHLKNDFQMKLVRLPINYRCPSVVVKKANRLIASNYRIDSKKQAVIANVSSTGDTVVTSRSFLTFQDEVNWVTKTLATCSMNHRANSVIFARKKRLLEITKSALESNGVEAHIAVPNNEFESAALQWVYSMLGLANDRTSLEDLRRVCESFCVVANLSFDINEIISHATTENNDILRSWIVFATRQQNLSQLSKKLIESSLELLERQNFWKFLVGSIERFDTLYGTEFAGTCYFNDYQVERDGFRQLVDEIASEFGRQKITLYDLLQELDLRSNLPGPNESAVLCSTIHAAKGVDFDHVYVLGMVEDIWPSWFAIQKGDGSNEMQEERRKCFVAVTSAEETLTLTYSNYVNGVQRRPSRFLAEMGILHDSSFELAS